MEMDLSDRESIRALIAEGQKYGPIAMLVNAAGVSPSQAPIVAILKVDLYGAAVLLEEVGNVIAPGGVGVTISSQSGRRIPALTAAEDEQLALDEFNGPRGDFYKNMFAKCPAGCPGTADEVANVADLLMSGKGAFITIHLPDRQRGYLQLLLWSAEAGGAKERLPRTGSRSVTGAAPFFCGYFPL